ncbi:hypothetical protein N9233_00485 [Flavobacteriales bacterium]|nr:hypothetical protein [Flavobacteriales bacterium]
MEKFLIFPLPVVTGDASGPVPITESVTDGTADGFLVDTAAEFVTDGVVAGDVVVNITSGGVTTVLTTPTVDGDNLAIASAVVDFFETGDAYRIMLAADANKLVGSGTSFTTDVSVGDVVLNANEQEANVVSVDSDTQLTLSAPIISTLPASPDAGTYYIYSENDNDGDRLFNISGIATVSHVSSTYCTVSYMDRKVGGGINQLSIYHTTDTSSLQFHHVLNDGIVNAYERQWKDVAIPFKLPSGMRITSIS